MNRMDSMVSQGMGTLRSVKARLSGLVGVWRVLAEQHGEVASLLERAKTSDEKFAQLWPTIRAELIAHERAELREIYPLLRSHSDLMVIADHHDTEAMELERLILTIDEMGIGTEDRRRAFGQLVEKVGHHAKEEENEIFPRAQKALGRPASEALEARFVAAKKQISEATH